MKITLPVIATTLLYTHQAVTAETQDLNVTIVTASLQSLEASPEISIDTIRQLSGGSSLIEAEDWNTQVVKPEDIFRFDPGVYARSNGTGNDTRLSVRGSGIQRRFGSRGITLFIDGIPANDSDGSFYFRAIDPLSISHIESFRGGNGLSHGANQLGGAIHLHQKTGISDPGSQISAEFGSFDTQRFHIEYGGSNDRWDWHAGYTQYTSDGYRGRQDQNSDHFTLNLGYHWSDQALTRFYGLFSDSDALLSGALTPEQFADEPRQAGTNGAQPRNPLTDRDLLTIRLGQKTSWETANSSWNFYTNYQYLDFDHLTTLSGSPGFNNLVDYDTDSFTTGLNGSYYYSLGGVENKLSVNSSFEYGRNKVGGFSGFISPAIPGRNTLDDIVNDREDTSTNWKIYLENDTTIKEKHHLIAGLGYIWTNRKRNIGSNNDNSSSFDGNQEGFLGKIGYLYNATENTQIFANISRSFEAAPFSEAEEFTVTDPQEAITYEIGARHQGEIFTSKVAVYLAEVNDEFIQLETAPNSGRTSTINEDTTHFGLEAATSIDLTELMQSNTDIQYRANFSYQLNDFTFEEGRLKGNEIPGVSKQVIATQLQAEGDRCSVAMTVDWLPRGITADNENNLETDGFATVELSASYDIKENLTLYGGIRNIFDEEYVSSVTINPAPTGSFLNPGDGRSFYAGVRYLW